MLKMGKISYTNVLPVYHYFDETKFTGKAQIIRQTPSELNQQMRQGTIDLGPISSFAYAENDSSYVIFPNLSVSSRGKVRSIFLFSKKPLDELGGSSIALTSSSATSVALLKIILEYFKGLNVSYQTMSPNLYEMMKEHDAALLIGDDALLANNEEHHYPYTYDLGEEWYKHTGKLMTFAVWAVRKEVTQKYSTLLTDIYESFVESKLRGQRERSKLNRELSQSLWGTEKFWSTYFSGLSYDFTEEHREGLEYYYLLASKIGLLPQPTTVRVWEPEKTLSKVSLYDQ